MTAPRPNLRSLDVLRGLLSFYVLAGHARWLLWTGNASWNSTVHAGWANLLAHGSAVLRFGHEAVLVFFVLSGFFIHLRLAKGFAIGDGPPFSTRPYLKRRAHRILPPYVLALIVTVVMDFGGSYLFPALYQGQTGDSLLDLNFQRKGYTVASTLPALLLVPTALDRDFGTNGPLWSIAYEIAYYALYPLWLAFRRWSLALAYGGVSSICLLLLILNVNSFAARVMSYYPIWLGGALVAELVLRRPSALRLKWAWMMVATAAFGLYVTTDIPFWRMLFAIIFGMAVVCLFAGLPERWCAHWWHRMLEAMGLRSYSIYVLHFPILVLISACVFAEWGERPASGYSAIGGAALSLAVCFGLFHLVERRFLHPRLTLERNRKDSSQPFQ
jgi:peptidoglycan/LPS O-acetylase OafA/YrhL